MTLRTLLRNLISIGLTCLVGGLLVSTWEQSAAFAQRDNTPPPAPPTMQDVQHLKDIVPPASHPMVVVAYNATNLWFAAQKRNWPLAGYYYNETRNRMRWETSLNPGPKGPDGNPIDMKSIFDGIDKGSLTTLKAAIDNKDSKQFVEQYKHMLEDCYSCHKAANRPYLRPQIPLAPLQTIINTNPDANWPQ